VPAPSPAPIAAILFDLDDTLWPIAPVIERAERLMFNWIQVNASAVAEAHSIASLRARRAELMQQEPRFRADLVALRHACLTEAFAACGEDVRAVDKAMQVFVQARNEVQTYADVDACLPALATRVRLGSLTNGAADLALIGLAQHFEVSVAAHQLGTTKPDPAIFHAACEAMQLAPAQVAYVGDDLRLDVEGAQQAGLTGIWMNRSGTPAAADLAHIRPDASVQSLHELDLWLSRHRQVWQGR